MGTGLVAPLADLVLPRACAGCGRPGRVLCPRCAALLADPRPAQPRRHPTGFPPTVAAGGYAGSVRPVVNAFKERGQADLAAPLGTALALAVSAVLRAARDGPGGVRPGPGRPVLLVPVPSTRAALRERGRDHVGELTAAAVRELRDAGLPVAAAPLLARRGRVRDSAGLSADERRANLAGSVVPVARGRRYGPGRDGVRPALLVLVDDVVTTGATLTVAAGVLAGHRHARDAPVVGAVVAATPLGRRAVPTDPGPGVFTVRDL
ncbi:phosphoribosyltransferase [Modestobacter sp. Leaf380]|nr:phosphoribosyltransferase [Modestobacter sp. Leaf380]